MDFSLSEVQKMLKREARSFLEKECPSKLVREMEEDTRGYSPELWHRIAELGWTAIPFPEKYGGAGGSFLDLIVLLEEMGRVCLPSPFIPSVILAGLTILDLGSEDQKEEFLPGIAGGGIICTLALLESSDSYEPTAITCQASYDGKGHHIQGTKLFVPDANIADFLLVAAKTRGSSQSEQGITLFIVDSKSQDIGYTLLKTIAGDKQFEVDLDVKVPQTSVLGKVGNAWNSLKKTLERAAVAKCAEMVGATQRILEMTLDYAKERQQFGHPIGSFQAIQHHCANMAMDVESSRLNTYHAAWLISEGLPSSRHVAVAKAWTGEAYRKITALSHQIHGAIGFTKELDLELYIRRAKAAEVAFGDGNYHRKIIAQELGCTTRRKNDRQP
jgi:alkylation response protein AidB-like acyl-CoA dehydrogenase